MRYFSGVFASVLAAAAVFTSNPAQAQCDAGEVKVVFSLTTAIVGHPKGNAASALADRVNDQLQGRMCMEIYGNGDLYDDDAVFDALLSGEVHLAAPSMSKFGAYTDQLQLFDLPFLFESPLAAMDFLSSDTAQGLKESVRSSGFIGLEFWTNGMKQISSTRPLIAPGDATGLTFRVQPSEVIEAQFDAIGARTKRLSFSKVYGALESGEVQGQQNTWSNIYTKKFHTVQDGVTESNHAYLGYLVVTSAAFLEGLDPELRQEFEFLLALTTHEYNRFAFETNQLRRQDIILEGHTVRSLTDAQRQAWRDAFQPLYARFAPVIGPDLISSALGNGGGS